MTPSEIRLALQSNFQAFINDVDQSPTQNQLDDINEALDAVYDGPGSIPVGPPPP